MQVNAELTGEAAALAQQHGEALARLPATLHAFILVELQKWPTLFPAEQRYQRALLDDLSGSLTQPVTDAIAAIARIETQAALDRIDARNLARFQDDAQARLRSRGLNVAWRMEVDRLFQSLDAALEAQLYPAGAPRRLVVQIYGSGIEVQRAKLWSRFKGVGMRVPLNLERADQFLAALFGQLEPGRGAPTLLIAGIESPVDGWIIESHEALHALCDSKDRGASRASLTGLSYDRLRPYRDELTRTLNRKIQSGVESPEAFAAFARSLRIVPPEGTLFYPSETVAAFVRDVLITGNGTLMMNNTFVEWSAIQALRRAQPRVLVTRFGVRDKLKPFSSMVMFSQPRAADRVPVAKDPAGSFIDVEQLSYYIWLNAEKNPAYRKKTLYLFLAEGVDEMLAVRSDGLDSPRRPSQPIAPARLADVHATMARWLGVSISAGAGQPILPLVS